MIKPSDTPAWPTTKRGRTDDGRLLGVDGSVWYYGVAPMAPVYNARSDEERLRAGLPTQAVIDELAAITQVNVPRRSMAKGGYRQIHDLTINLPTLYTAERDKALYEYLSTQFGHLTSVRRCRFFGVKLLDKIGGTGGWRQAVDSVVETIVAGTTPLSDYDADFELIKSVFERCGIRDATDEELRLADAWFNHGDYPDVPTVEHPDHLHVFETSDAVMAAHRAGVDECEHWAERGVHGEAAITFANVQDFDLPFIHPASDDALWGSDLLKAGALAISIRGQVEPGAITRNVLRSNRAAYRRDIQERYAQGKMDKQEQEETEALLGAVEGMYASSKNPPATLSGASIVIGFNGVVPDLTRVVGHGSRAKLSNLSFRQYAAFGETMLCSPVRANPHLHDLPAQVIGFAGLGSLDTVGDTDGAALGFTEEDRQMARVSPIAASVGDALPLALCAGATGSGKLLTLSTKIPTPSGYTTMGELKLGDEVLGSDGLPTRVTYLSPINETPILYRVTFSDGQQVIADHDHQWLVSDFHGRNSARKGKHQVAIANWESKQGLIGDLLNLADEVTGTLTLDEVFTLVHDHVPSATWKTKAGVREALDMVDCPFWLETRILPRSYAYDTVHKTDPAKLFPYEESLHALYARWTQDGGGNAARWAGSMRNRADAVEALCSDIIDPHELVTAPEIVRRLQGAGAVFPARTLEVASDIRRFLRSMGIASVDGFAPVVVPVSSSGYTTQNEVRVYDARIAVKALAQRVSEQYHTRPREDALTYRMNTGEMLAQGLRKIQGHAQFAVPVASSVVLPQASVLVDPYILGAWLGDGRSNGAQFTCDVKNGDRERLVVKLLESGYQAQVLPSSAKTIGTRGLRTQLRKAGLLKNKHIPEAYLRASHDQRLAVLQGLMDTDGTVSKAGACELSLSDKRLATDALDLIRSLGIKASVSWDRPASYRDSEGNEIGCKNRHRIKFTTDLPVFTLPRKLERLPAPGTLRETAKWNYITDITPITTDDPDYGPGRCITVDNEDHTYLCGDGYLVTSNTQAALHLLFQYAKMGHPGIFIDPKLGSAHDDIVLAAGGQVASLDDLTKADGIFDPIRFAKDPKVGVELAASVLMQINLWGDQASNMEVPLFQALNHGVHRGATCIGQALQIAQAEIGKDLPPNLIPPVFQMANTSPQLRAIVGIDPATQALSVADGITLIKVGNSHLDLPPPGQPGVTIPQRVALALVRLMVYGSAMALTDRYGVVMLDEAWVFLGAGRNEVERLGRLARSQKVLPMLFTQRVTDALNAGLAGYISRGIILPIEDRDEAKAALELFKIEPTEERLRRITGKAEIADSLTGGGKSLNWDSMRALKDPETGEVQRGSIAIYVDLAGRAIPVEVVLPKEFLALSSTSPEDIAKRERLKAERAQAAQHAQFQAANTPVPAMDGLSAAGF